MNLTSPVEASQKSILRNKLLNKHLKNMLKIVKQDHLKKGIIFIPDNTATWGQRGLNKWGMPTLGPKRFQVDLAFI